MLVSAEPLGKKNSICCLSRLMGCWASVEVLSSSPLKKGADGSLISTEGVLPPIPTKPRGGEDEEHVRFNSLTSQAAKYYYAEHDESKVG